MISIGFMVIGSNMLQSHLLSTTTMKRLLLGICWTTKDLSITAGDKDEEGRKEERRKRSVSRLAKQTGGKGAHG